MNLTKHFTHCGYLKSQFEKGLIKNVDQLKTIQHLKVIIMKRRVRNLESKYNI